MQNESSVPVSSIAKGNEGHRHGELICKNYSENIDIIVHTMPNKAINCYWTTTTDTDYTISAMDDTPDDRIITLNQLKAKISECDDLNEKQCDQLLTVLMKYQSHLTKQPGKCTRFECHFNIAGRLPLKDHPTCFAWSSSSSNTRYVKWWYIGRILLRLCKSPYSGASGTYLLRMCMDARGVKRQMTPDRVKVAPIR